MVEVRFHIAGLPVAVRAARAGDLDDLAGVYRAFPTTAPPALTIDIERVAATDRDRGPEYPAFRRGRSADGRLGVERFDADGEVDTGELPLTAQFRVGPSANSLEACIRIAASVALARAGALIFHASAVEVDGHVLAFTGVSGAGKSTISALLDRPPARKIGDELLVVRREPAGWSAYVPPYLGPAGVAHGAHAPLAAIHLLVQAPHHAREPVAPAAAVRELMRHVLVYVAEPRTAGLVLELVADLAQAVPCHRLFFRKDPDVATVLGIAPARAAG